MRIALFAAAALMLGTAGIAQDTPQPTDQPSGETVDDPSQSMGPEGQTQQGTDPNGTGTAPAGTNQPMNNGSMNQGNMSQGNMTQGNMTQGNMSQGNMSQGNMAGMSGQAAGNYPPCSRTVTDRCIQTYERGVRRARGRR